MIFGNIPGIVHRERFGKSYHFSWLAVGRDRKWTWEEARNYCRDFCMDSISISSRAENDWVKNVLRNNELDYIWTGGRKCNFAGCERADLQPAIENGWYWAPTGQRMPPPASCPYCGWSRTGGLGTSQPDNREQRQGGRDEACVAVLNNFYQVRQSQPANLCTHFQVFKS